MSAPLSEPLRLAEGFDPPAPAAWQRLLERTLKGGSLEALRSATRDGIVVEPLYDSRRDVGPITPRRRSAPWRIVQAVDHPDPAAAAAQAARDLEGGATGLSIRLAGAAAAAGFGLPATAAALAAALGSVATASIAIRLEPHPHGGDMAVSLAERLATHGADAGAADVAFGLDPVTAPFLAGREPADAAALAAWAELRARGFAAAMFEADGRPWHEAGASEAQELAAMLASVAHILRLLDRHGVGIDEAFPAIGVSLAVDCDQFLGIAKPRAARLLWSRLQEACGAAAAPCRLHAETSRRMMTTADPHTNLLRTTLACFAAGAGGADSVLVAPFTSALGLPERFARRLARNIQHLVVEEAQAHRVADPGAGAGAVEALTEALAERAWAEFQAIEAEGGLAASLAAGRLPERVAAARRRLIEDVAAGRLRLVGATVYRPAAPTEVAVEAAVRGAVAGAGGLAPLRLEAAPAEAEAAR